MADGEGVPARPLCAGRVRDHPVHHLGEKDLRKRSLPQPPDTENDEAEELKRAKQRVLREWQSEDAGVTPLHELAPVPAPALAPSPLHPLATVPSDGKGDCDDDKGDGPHWPKLFRACVELNITPRDLNLAEEYDTVEAAYVAINELVATKFRKKGLRAKLKKKVRREIAIRCMTHSSKIDSA